MQYILKGTAKHEHWTEIASVRFTIAENATMLEKFIAYTEYDLHSNLFIL